MLGVQYVKEWLKIKNLFAQFIIRKMGVHQSPEVRMQYEAKYPSDKT